MTARRCSSYFSMRVGAPSQGEVETSPATRAPSLPSIYQDAEVFFYMGTQFDDTPGVPDREGDIIDLGPAPQLMHDYRATYPLKRHLRGQITDFPDPALGTPGEPRNKQTGDQCTYDSAFHSPGRNFSNQRRKTAPTAQRSIATGPEAFSTAKKAGSTAKSAKVDGQTARKPVTEWSARDGSQCGNPTFASADLLESRGGYNTLPWWGSNRREVPAVARRR